MIVIIAFLSFLAYGVYIIYSMIKESGEIIEAEAENKKLLKAYDDMITIYTATDGMKFTTKTECYQYEQKLLYGFVSQLIPTAEERFNSSPHRKIDGLVAFNGKICNVITPDLRPMDDFLDGVE